MPLQRPPSVVQGFLDKTFDEIGKKEIRASIQ